MTQNIDNKDFQVQLLQENLSAIRKIAGWTARILFVRIRHLQKIHYC
ncbi:MAG TPA: hypothetical protein PK074_11635 [Spirochaetales bacterium]|jgi:hypothetical protein|nr:hypothetical protein [Spirochaetales bacterium]